MERQETNAKRMRKGKMEHSEASPISLSLDNIFPLLLASLFDSQNKTNSQSIIIKCLTKLLSETRNPSFATHQTLPVPILSLLPTLLKSSCPEIAFRSAEIVGAVSLLSLGMNEQIALDDDTVKALIWAVASSKRRVLIADCNALLDLSITSIGRQRLLNFCSLERLMHEEYQFQILNKEQCYR